jgi:glycosyltransferase involved in cell wall biosynthesis
LNSVGHELERVNSVVAEKISLLNSVGHELRKVEGVVVEKDLLLSNIGCELGALRADLHQEQLRYKVLTQSRLFRLRSAIVASPLNFEKIVRVCYLSVSIITPALFRDGARSLVNKLKSGFLKRRSTLPVIDVGDSYLVKQPASVANDRPRVVHVIANFMTGGSSRLVVDIYEYMSGSFEQSIITSYAPSPPAYIGIDIDEIRFPENEQPFIARLKLINPDLIHLHYWGDCDEPWYAKAVRAAELLSIPVVQNINTPISPYMSDSIKRYVYVSNYVRRVFGIDEPSHVTVYPGSDFTMFESHAVTASTEDWIGMVYRLEADKLNADSIIPFILAVQKRPQTRVLIVGGGSLMEPFQCAVEQAGVSNNFEFTGYVPYTALPDLYRRMKLFVAPVWKESFGQVSPFAMNMRVPVVGFDIGAIGEIVEDASLLAPYGGAAALSDIIVSLLDDTPRRLAIAERQHNRAQANFSVQAMIAGYRDIYTAVARETYK